MEEKFKGTLGAWGVFGSDPILFIENDNAESICAINNFMAKDEYEANAKLIACAPEMLEMLNVLLKEPRIREAMALSGENSILNDNVKKAEQLIKKATK